MGLEALSTPMRLAVVIGATALVLLLVMGLIVRRRRAAMNLVANNLDGDLPSPQEMHIRQTAIDAASETPLSPAYPKASGKNMGPQISENLQIILKLSKIIATTAPSNELRQYAKRIRNTASNTALLIDNAELSADIDAANLTTAPTSINFYELVRSQSKKWSTTVADENIQLTCFIDDKIPECLFLDPKLLHRIINSLLTNSHNLTKKGRIHLHITGENSDDYDWVIKMILADTGSGFSNAFKTKFNDDGEMPKPKTVEHTNLIAASHLVNLMQGRIDLKSVQGRGTEVMVVFPARTAMVIAEKDHNGSKQKGPGALAGRRILIIEDDRSSQDVLKTFLAPEGCHIDCIDDGIHAIETLEKTHYDLVLMDVRMNGLDGIKTTRAIRRSDARYRDVPIIAITADTSPETNAKCMMAGVDLFLTKPVSAKGLFDAIRFVMDLGSDIRQSSSPKSQAEIKTATG